MRKQEKRVMAKDIFIGKRVVNTDKYKMWRENYQEICFSDDKV